MVRLKYVDGDPLILIKIFNPSNDEWREVYAYVDSGSDSIVIPRDIWLDLNLAFKDRVPISTVAGPSNTWVALCDIELFGESHKKIPLFYQDEGDVLLGRTVIDKYIVTFDGITETLGFGKA